MHGVRTQVRIRAVKPGTAALIRMMLSSAADDVIVKTGLQRACELMEAGQAFPDPRILEVALRRHLTSTDLKVRRWSYKLAGRLRHKELLPLLRDAVDKEAMVDAENRSWALAAYLGYAPQTERDALIRKLDQEYYESALELAARFFVIGEPEEVQTAFSLKHFERDPLGRKWLSMLVGYAATEPRTIHRYFKDLDLVRDAVWDPDPENVEYSLWAENRHPKGSYTKLRAKPHELLEHDNVKRWLFQLLTKTERAAKANRELLLRTMDATLEPSPLVREGLALGLAKVEMPDFKRETIDWYLGEPDPKVKLALVDHLVRRAEHGDPIALSALQSVYAALPRDDLVAMKINAASRPEWLAAIKSERGEILVLTGQLDLFDLKDLDPQRPIIIHAKEINVDNSKNVNASGNASVSGVFFGDVIESTITAISQARDERILEAAPVFEEFLRTLEHEPIDPFAKENAATLIKEVAEAPTPEAKKSKLGMLKLVANGLIKAPGLSVKFLTDAQTLIHTVSGLIA